MLYSTLDLVIIFLGIAAAWSMGHHYSGAVVGPAFGSRSIGMYTGIALAGVFVVIGSLATRVVSTYVNLASLSAPYSAVVLFSLVLMTNVTTYLKIPTSTIQLYAFSLLGAAVATGATLNLPLLGFLAFGWAVAPLISFFLSRWIYSVLKESKYLRFFIIGIMMYSGLVLGLNDVSNAASSLVSSGLDLTLSKLICGVSMYLGMIVWGPRLVKRVGEELIQMDYRKAVSAQLTMSFIVSSLNVFLGLNASMNQTTISGLASLGARKHVLRSIVTGWIYSPLIGFVTAYVLAIFLRIYGA